MKAYRYVERGDIVAIYAGGLGYLVLEGLWRDALVMAITAALILWVIGLTKWPKAKEWER